MSSLDDYRKGKIAALDPEKLKEESGEKRQEQMREYWRQYLKEHPIDAEDSKPMTKDEKAGLGIVAAVHIIIAILGCAIWIAAIVFLFQSCSGG